MDTTTELVSRYGAYLNQLALAIAHQDRVESLIAYISGLTLPAERKSRSAAAVEPIAARIEPGRVSARHQSLLHFVGQSLWDDRAVLAVARDDALAQLLTNSPLSHWIIDDTGFPPASLSTEGKHSVGVANQYCGILGKNANAQVTVSLSVANRVGSIPVAFLYGSGEPMTINP